MREFWLYTERVGPRAGTQGRPPGPDRPVTVVGVGGSLDYASAPLLSEHLFIVLARRGPCIALDLGELTFLDSSGVGVMINYWKRASDAGGTLCLVAPPARVTGILERMGLDRYLRYYPDVQSFLDTLRPTAEGQL